MRLHLHLSIDISGRGFRLVDESRQLIQQLRVEQSTRPPVRNHPVASNGFLWRYTSPMEEHRSRWVPHRIVRWSTHAVLVEAHPFDPGRASSNSNGRTYWIDRGDLERLGVSRVRSRKIAFFKDQNATRQAILVVDALLRLGLWFPFTEDDLKQAYRRRALLVHPDAGGSDERFVQLQDDYDLALMALDYQS